MSTETKSEYDPNCSFCRKDKLAPQPYFDNICWETVCPNPACNNQGSPMLVLNRHTETPTDEEIEHIRNVARQRHPDKKFRGYMQSNTKHWHDHLI